MTKIMYDMLRDSLARNGAHVQKPITSRASVLDESFS